jgi:HK97 family phage major capsid protein/HK97 family phage prohead protease
MKETKDLAFDLKFDGGDTGAFEGLAAGYGNVDHGGDVFEPGVFASSLAEHKSAGTRPALLWSHNPDEPIGVIDHLAETADGLTIKGRLALETTKGREARAFARIGAVTGLSVGFYTKQSTRNAQGVRRITAAHLGEVSFVTSPMNDRARLASVKAADAATSKEKHMEKTTDAATEDADLKTKMTDLEKSLADAVKRADDLELKMTRPGAIASPEDDAKALRKKSFNFYLRAGTASLADAERKSLGLEAKAMTVGDPNASVLAPPEFAAEILKNLVQFSPVRGVARVMSLSGPEVKIPKRTGAPTAHWVTETGDRQETEITYGQATLTPHEIACYIDVSNQLLEDSAYDVASEVAVDLAEEFGRAEGAAFVNGTGTGQPFGFMADTSITQVHAGVDDLATTAKQSTFASSLAGFIYKLPSPYASRGVWMMNRTTIGAIRTLKDSTGRFLWADSMTEGQPATLMGRPVVEVPDMPDIAAGAVPIVFGDMFSSYRIVDRVTLALLRDPYTRATNGMTRFHARRRVGGQVVKAEAVRALLMAA